MEWPNMLDSQQAAEENNLSLCRKKMSTHKETFDMFPNAEAILARPKNGHCNLCTGGLKCEKDTIETDKGKGRFRKLGSFCNQQFNKQ